ncbi:alpha/beta hydrolase [Nocardia alba]|uniref:Fermentation-respiration switch protein FrsA (DUF1100 family) n=1 Tax=Nocardia alba TaxID=225051 RepID=A0A4R1FR31_9NOCA|nr:alpha/beta hydrolase [Nocardia alba]TCJ97163.1 fermentation-respiration switch protein FrsA (DUF1100 family) [Nocardia alba]
MPHSLTFISTNASCDAWHFPAVDDRLATPAGRPAAVMAHGFAGTKDCGLDSFAQGLAETGLDVIAFDYRGFGDSGGEPRQVISPADQVEDYRAALRAAAELPGVDARRLVLWGVSMSGGTILEVAAGRTDIAAVIALTPMVTGLSLERPRHSAPEDTARSSTSTVRLLLRAGRDKAATATGRGRVMLPVISRRPGDPALMNIPGAHDDYLSIAGPTWRNEVNASIALDALSFRPSRYATQLTCPALFQIADFDRYVPTAAALKAAVRARAQVRHYPCDHFDVYPAKQWHETIRDHQSRFLGKVLGKPAVAIT